MERDLLSEKRRLEDVTRHGSNLKFFGRKQDSVAINSALLNAELRWNRLFRRLDDIKTKSSADENQKEKVKNVTIVPFYLQLLTDIIAIMTIQITDHKEPNVVNFSSCSNTTTSQGLLKRLKEKWMTKIFWRISWWVTPCNPDFN